MGMLKHDYGVFLCLWNYENFITSWLWDIDGYNLWYAIPLCMNEKNEQKNYMEFTSKEWMNECLMSYAKIHGPSGMGFRTRQNWYQSTKFEVL